MAERSVGLMCAIPSELAMLRPLLEAPCAQTVMGFRFDEGNLFGRRVVLAETGIGKVSTAAVTTLLATRFDVAGLLFTGVAGGLDPSLSVGDVVVSTHVLQHDCGVFERGQLSPYQAGHVPFFNPTSELGHRPPPGLVEAARAALAGVELASLPAEAGGGQRPAQLRFAAILTGDQYVHCEQTRERLRQAFGAAAVAMEGAAMAQLAERLQLPWLEVRALSDLAGADSRFDFARFAEVAAESACQLTKHLLPLFP